MKAKLIGRFFIVCILCFYSCGGDDDETDSDLPDLGTMSATIMSPKIMSHKVQFHTFYFENKNPLSIYGSKCDKKENIQINLGFPKSLGSYTFVDDESTPIGASMKTGVGACELFWYDPDHAVTYYKVVEGNVNITQLNDKNIKGTFQFKFEDSSGHILSATNGVFDVNFE